MILHLNAHAGKARKGFREGRNQLKKTICAESQDGRSKKRGGRCQVGARERSDVGPSPAITKLTARTMRV